MLGPSLDGTHLGWVGLRADAYLLSLCPPPWLLRILIVMLGALSVISGLATHVNGGSPSVHLPNGDGGLTGIAKGNHVEFHAVPFAQPPVGKLRWQAPQKNTGWHGTRDATKFAPNCAQMHWKNPVWHGLTNEFSEDW